MRAERRRGAVTLVSVAAAAVASAVVVTLVQGGRQVAEGRPGCSLTGGDAAEDSSDGS